MAYLRNFLLFWFDFIVGGICVIAAGVVIALRSAALLAQRGLGAWWLMPVAVAALLAVSTGEKLGARNSRCRGPCWCPRPLSSPARQSAALA